MLDSCTSAFGRSATALLALAAAALCVPSATLAHRDGAYWHDDGRTGFNPQWMLTISPQKTLADLSLPGTHDSGTYTGEGGPNVRTQTMTIREQLDSGIRWLDIRLKYVHPTPFKLWDCNARYTSPDCQLRVFHGIFMQPVLFERDVLVPTISFLRANPSETVVMRIAMETSQCDCDPGPALDALLAREAVLDGRATGQKYADWLLPLKCPDPERLALGPVRPLNAKPDPTSCDARGKLLIYDQYMSELATNHAYRHEFDRGGTYTEPAYGPISTIKDFYDDLWLPVKRYLQSANLAPPPAKTLYRAGIVHNGPSFPFFFASGHAVEDTDSARLSTGLVVTAGDSTWPDFPRTNCFVGLCTISYEGMNILVADYLGRPEFRRPNSRVGIINADFPGNRLITAVAGVNHGVTFNRPTFAYTMTTPGGRAYQPGTWTNRPVQVTPVCNVVCSGDRGTVTEDLPEGFTYTMTGGGSTVTFAASPVRIDTVPPTITAAATTAPGPTGWYAANVAVRFSCADGGGSGLASCPPDQVLSGNGSVSSAVQYAFDTAGNKSVGSNVVSAKIDKIRPSVAYRGNQGSYAPGQMVDIACEAFDRESGIASSTCAGIRGLASTFGTGTHRFSASAVDVAGNTSAVTTSFTVVALPGDVTGDGSLDCRDVATVKAAFGKRSGMAGFDARADINGDALVDIRDLSFVTQKLPPGTACA